MTDATPGTPTSAPEADRRRRTFAPVVLLGLAGAALAVAGATRPWITTAGDTGADAPAPLDPTPGGTTVDLVSGTLSGTDLNPLVGALALVALASWGAVLVLRGRVRRVVAVLGVLASLGGVAAWASTELDPAALQTGPAGGGTTTAWPTITAIALAVTAVAFVLAVRDAARWPSMSSRYDTPTGASAPQPARVDPSDEDPREVWRAIEDGDDPTA
ncbi:Trp biosynthesis-associated membrane protein [Nocardioidaceae bacterium]|nr:Trp biosynthesis-associated membrane protein [Nocardioidaceae bacterium]